MTDEAHDAADAERAGGPDPDVVLRLPDDLRSAFKDPLGPIRTDAEALLADVSGPLVTVGDVVTYHVLGVDRTPDVAVVDGRTEREAVDEEVAAAVSDPDAVHVTNPPATLTADLFAAVRAAVAAGEPGTVVVDGEEDLAVLPAVLAAPPGASVVYGQPGQGMVHVRVTDRTKERVRSLLERMDGDATRALELLDAGDR